MNLKHAIRMVLSASALVYIAPAVAQEDAMQTLGIEEIVVTAQKREEGIQSVPIAVTALTAEALTTQRINLAQDLARAVPNLYYSRAGLGFNETNFQLRGIGYQLVSTAGDAGVGVHVNNAPLGVNRMGQSEIYDLERVEVLRGPQGTLYGRNATGGVLNMITAKPEVGVFGGEGSIEYGDYDHKRVGGHLNIPMGGLAALRVAGFGLQRDGYTTNTFAGSDGDVDGREMWSGRATLAVNPNGAFRTTLMWQRSAEDDDRVGNTQMKCIKDPGPTSVGGVAINSAQARGLLNKGCLEGSIYSPAANGSVNYQSAFAGQLGSLSGLYSGDAFAGVVNSSDLREVAMAHEPTYKSTNDLYTLNIEVDVTDSLTVTSLTAHMEDQIDTRSDGLPYIASASFNALPGVTPGGVYTDPQSGASTHPYNYNMNDLHAEQLSQELRLQSKFEGPVNFNIGGMFMNLERMNDVYITSNTGGAFTLLSNTYNIPGGCTPVDCYYDTNVDPDGTGHNYYLSRNPYELKASAVFGEVYWDATERFTLTTGLRYTKDEKTIENTPITLLSAGRGWPATGPLAIVEQEAEWTEMTGRVNGAWRVTDDNLIYVSYSKGYKGGGINAPDFGTGNLSPSYEPEFVNAYEIGSKNEFLGGSVQVNATAFFYDYEGYQVSSLRGFTVATENVDAEVQGLELEGVWQPLAGLRLNANVGLLGTELQEGSSVDTFNRTQGDPTQTYVKSTTAGCMVPTSAMATFVTLLNNGTPFIPVAGGGTRAAVPQDILGICAGSFAGLGLTPSPGVAVDLKGNELPQAPDLTTTVGAQYRWDFASGWSTTVRADYYYQTEAFTRVYNTESDYLEGWDNANATLTLSNDSLGWDIQIYGKNLMDDDVITGFDTSSEALGIVRNVSVLDPRLFGVVVKKSF